MIKAFGRVVLYVARTCMHPCNAIGQSKCSFVFTEFFILKWNLLLWNALFSNPVRAPQWKNQLYDKPYTSLLHDSIIYLANLPHNQMSITALASRINNYVYHYILFKYSNIYIHYLIHIYHLIKYTLMDHIYSDLYITFMVCAGTRLCRHR